MSRLDDLQRVEVRTPEELDAWLAAHHHQPESVWLVRPKGGGFPYDAVVDTALCWGWIDSLPRMLDETRTMLLLSPRKPRSVWSAVNKARVERLVRDGRMQPAGLAKVEAAKADGGWSSIDEAESLTEPDELRAALDALPDARRRWDRFPPSSRRGILGWIAVAKSADTRARRVAETARLAAENRKANHPPGHDSGPKD